MAFAVSIVVFSGGLANFAWAVTSQGGQGAVGASAQPITPQRDTSSELYGDLVIPGEEPEESAEPAGQEAGEPGDATALTEQAPGSPAQAQPNPWPGDDASSSMQEPATSAPAYTEQPRTQGTVIHHSAGVEVPVYKTVHHQASTAREVTVAGSTHIEWTTCPVCAQRHARAYNERVVDHVNRIGCTACGNWHESAYDEVVN